MCIPGRRFILWHSLTLLAFFPLFHLLQREDGDQVWEEQGVHPDYQREFSSSSQPGLEVQGDVDGSGQDRRSHRGGRRAKNDRRQLREARLAAEQREAEELEVCVRLTAYQSAIRPVLCCVLIVSICYVHCLYCFVFIVLFSLCLQDQLKLVKLQENRGVEFPELTVSCPFPPPPPPPFRLQVKLPCAYSKLAFRRTSCRRASSLKSLKTRQPKLKNVSFFFFSKIVSEST